MATFRRGLAIQNFGYRVSRVLVYQYLITLTGVVAGVLLLREGLSTEQ